MHALPITYRECNAIFTKAIEGHRRSILFTAADPWEGVSTIAYATAQQAAAHGKTVLLLDFNTRHSYPRDVLALPAASWSLGQPIPESAVHVIQQDGLAILPAPIERSFGVDARQNAEIRKLLDHFLAQFDLIIGDTSCLTKPNSYGLAAQDLAREFDGTILIVSSGATQKETISQALASLKEAGTHLIGCVLNDRNNPALSDEFARQFNKLGVIGRWFHRLASPLLNRLTAVEGHF